VRLQIILEKGGEWVKEKVDSKNHRLTPFEAGASSYYSPWNPLTASGVALDLEAIATFVAFVPGYFDVAGVGAIFHGKNHFYILFLGAPPGFWVSIEGVKNVFLTIGNVD